MMLAVRQGTWLRGAAVAACLACCAAGAQTAPEPFTIVEADRSVTFEINPPPQTGWVEATDAAGTPDTLSFRLSGTAPVTVTVMPGSDLRHDARTHELPLQLALRAQGRGYWLDGTEFATPGNGWTEWSGWQDAGASAPSFAPLVFRPVEMRPLFAVELRARVERSGLSDPAGVYRQTTPVQILIAPAN